MNDESALSDELPDAGALNPIALVEHTYTADQREQVADYLQVPQADPALIPYLSSCLRYGLDPFGGDLWLLPVDARAKDGDDETTQLRVATGRDGYLKIANRQDTYRGMKWGVHCANDSLRIEQTTDGEWDDVPKVTHVIDFAKDDAEGRGEVLGAWAVARADGKAPVFFYADIAEYGQVTLDENGKQLGFEGAWKYTSAMILKCAQSYVLRILYGITGIVPADELRGRDTSPVRVESTQEYDFAQDAADAVRRVENSDLSAELLDEIANVAYEVNETDPASYPAATLSMILGGATEGRARSLLAEMRAKLSPAAAETAAA